MEEFDCVDSIKNFWLFEGQSSTPIAACANRSATKILGASEITPIDQVLHFFQDNNLATLMWAKPLQEMIPVVDKVTCLEVSFDESRVYLAGETRKTGGLP